MDRSPGFGSTSHNFFALFRLDFSSAPHFSVLNLAMKCNSLDRSTKSTISQLNALYLLVNIGFQVLFTPLPGFFSPFPHGTLSLSVTEEYLALEGGPSYFPQGSSCLVVLWILLLLLLISSTGLSPSSVDISQFIRLSSEASL